MSVSLSNFCTSEEDVVATVALRERRETTHDGAAAAPPPLLLSHTCGALSLPPSIRARNKQAPLFSARPSHHMSKRRRSALPKQGREEAPSAALTAMPACSSHDLWTCYGFLVT